MKSSGDRAVTWVVVATGVSTVVTQLLIIRECLAQFRGNEFVIALTLFNWLILGGIGTLAARTLTRRFFRATMVRLGWLSLVLAALPVVQILAIRLVRDRVFPYGVSVGFYQTLGYTFGTMAPYSLLVGFVLPYSLYVLRSVSPGYPGARIYIADNLGDVGGGVLFAFVLVHRVTPFQGILLSSLPLVICALLVFPGSARHRPAPVVGCVLVLTVLIAGAVFEPRSLAPPTGQLVYYRESRYGRMTVHQDREQVTLFEDGVPVLSSRNPVAAEEAVHYPMAQIEKAGRVLLISAQSGMIAELEKYRPESIDYVELNPEVTRLQFTYRLIRNVPYLNVIHMDGRAFLSRTDARYDAILVNLPEPETFQANRFFTGGFFSLAQKRLTPGGVLCFSVEGFENYLAEPQRQKISSLFNTAEGYFDHVLMLPGEKIYFLCSAKPMSADIPDRLGRKGIATRYISRYYAGNLTAERIRALRALVDSATPRNTDTSPRLMRIMFTQWFAKYAASPKVFIAVIGVLGSVYLFRLPRETFVLFSTGFMTMGSEILVIFAFQTFFGYVYTQIGLIVTVFLAGLMPGAWIGQRLRRLGRRVLVWTDLMLMVLMALFIASVVQWGGAIPAVFFYAFGFTVSLACGCQFPVALACRGDDDATAALAFSADLTGAAFGTLFTSLVMLPYTGLFGAAVGLMTLKFFSLTMAGRGRETDH